MEILRVRVVEEKTKLYKLASALAIITVLYNIAEGTISVFFGLEDETAALFGFGLDSFVEVISGIGIWHMIRRLNASESTKPDVFERRALRITGSAFYLLTIGLALMAIVNVVQQHTPETTLWGIVIALVSIFSMWALIHFKVKVGKKLNSHAILADANCTKACLYLSVVLLVASVGYELSGIGGIDSLGAVFIAWLSFREGREAFQKARGEMLCTCGGNCD